MTVVVCNFCEKVLRSGIVVLAVVEGTPMRITFCDPVCLEAWQSGLQVKCDWRMPWVNT